MESIEPTNKVDQEQLVDEIKHTKDMWFRRPMHLCEGFWCFDKIVEVVIAFQNQFQAYDSDIILASMMKTGTTWVKSLLFTIVNRKNSLSNTSQLPLHIKNPHELVPHFELKIYNVDQPDLSNIPSPRLFATHMTYLSLPTSIKTSKCQIVYVLFLEFEGLKKEPKANLKRLAEFVGFPFSEEEEKANVIDDILELCSFKSLKEMEVNKSGRFYPWFENKVLFRKGEVGDWTDYLTPTMAKRIDVVREKLTKA
ncbi:Cytosolic sulfotransferase 12, partial [Bienertia sinuspersici]